MGLRLLFMPRLTCCSLLNRCISSTNKIVLRRNIVCSFFATLMTSLTSATPDMVADSFTNLLAFAFLVLLAMMFARVVYLRKNK